MFLWKFFALSSLALFDSFVKHHGYKSIFDYSKESKKKYILFNKNKIYFFCFNFKFYRLFKILLRKFGCTKKYFVFKDFLFNLKLTTTTKRRRILFKTILDLRLFFNYL